MLHRRARVVAEPGACVHRFLLYARRHQMNLHRVKKIWRQRRPVCYTSLHVRYKTNFNFKVGLIMLDDSVSGIYAARITTRLARPLLLWRVPAGFPSPAEDYVEGSIDL